LHFNVVEKLKGNHTTFYNRLVTHAIFKQGNFVDVTTGLPLNKISMNTKHNEKSKNSTDQWVQKAKNGLNKDKINPKDVQKKTDTDGVTDIGEYDEKMVKKELEKTRPTPDNPNKTHASREVVLVEKDKLNEKPGRQGPSKH
jgi:hypothetical protein